MRKYSLVAFCLLFSFFSYSQEEKWVSSAFIELISNNKGTYTYYDPDKIQEKPFSSKGSIELSYNIDYKIFKKFSIGAVAGFAHFNKPQFSSIKTGLGLKLLYVDDKYHYLTLQYGYHIPLDKDKFREGHQIRIGQYFDLANILDKRLILGVFYNYDFFYLDGSKPLFIETNKPSSLLLHSYGISLGVKF